jgi:hypothetical protein
MRCPVEPSPPEMTSGGLTGIDVADCAVAYLLVRGSTHHFQCSNFYAMAVSVRGRHEELGLQNEDFEETAVEIQSAPYNPKPFHKHMMSPSSEATLRVTSMTLNGIWCEVVRTDQQPLLGTVAFIGRGDPFLRDRDPCELANTTVGAEITLRAVTDGRGLRKTDILSWSINRHPAADLSQNIASDTLNIELAERATDLPAE